MLEAKQRNRKINHIIESSINDFCKVLKATYYKNDEAVIVSYENEDLFYVFPEFDERNYDINIICLVFQDLGISKAAKLREIYNADEVVEYVRECDSSLWFLDDSRLVMSQTIESKYSEYAILKSKILLSIYANVINARRLKDKLEVLLAESEQVSVN